jgi:hypothetical protein
MGYLSGESQENMLRFRRKRLDCHGENLIRAGKCAASAERLSDGPAGVFSVLLPSARLAPAIRAAIFLQVRSRVGVFTESCQT